MSKFCSTVRTVSKAASCLYFTYWLVSVSQRFTYNVVQNSVDTEIEFQSACKNWLEWEMILTSCNLGEKQNIVCSCGLFFLEVLFNQGIVFDGEGTLVKADWSHVEGFYMGMLCSGPWNSCDIWGHIQSTIQSWCSRVQDDWHHFYCWAPSAIENI